MSRQSPLQAKSHFFPSHFFKTILPYLQGPTFDASFQTAKSTCRCVRAGVAHGEIMSHVLFTMYVNMSSPFRHVELVPNAEDTAVIATSPISALLVKYLEAYLSELDRWLLEWRIAINVSKSRATSPLRPVGAFRKPGQFQLFRGQSTGSKPPVMLG